jgi:outer membrane protein assembly factor BamB
VVVIGSCNGIVRTLDLRTGRVRWETKVSPDSTQYFFHGDPYIAKDVIVAAADRAAGASIHAFDRSTGKELWRHVAGRGVNGPLAGDGLQVYAGTLEGQLLGLAVASGAVRWSLPLKVPGFEGPATVRRRVVAGTVQGTLHSVNAQTGQEEWRRDLGSPVTTSPSVSTADVYVGTADGVLHRVAVDGGRVLGSQKLDPVLTPTGVPVRLTDSILILLNDTSANYRAVVSVNAALTRINWRLAADDRWSTSRVFAWGDLVVLGTPSGDAVAYCTDTGAKSWTRTVKGPVRAIGGSGDTLLVGTSKGGLSAFRAPRSCRSN